MTMDRPTQKLIAPSGKEVVLYTYLTAREVREINSMTFKSVGISQKTEPNAQGRLMSKPEPTFDAAAAIEGEENKLVELAVVSFDGVAQPAVLDALLSGPFADWAFVIEQAKKLLAPT